MAYDSYYTEDLADFGYREFDLAADLFAAYKNGGFPDDFQDYGVKLALNMASGYVFFTNSDYQVCMDSDGKLYSFYTTPYSGFEGFAEDLFYEADESWDREDLEYLLEIAEYNDISDEDIAKVQALIDDKEE